jgi:hypothetical protein
MGTWDEICLICGMRLGGGPDILYRDLETFLAKLLQDLQGQNLNLDLDKDQLTKEIRDILLLFEPDMRRSIKYKEVTVGLPEWSVPYFPSPLWSDTWAGWEAIAIGTFNDQEHGFVAFTPVNIKFPRGFVSYVSLLASLVDFITGRHHSPRR